MPTILLVDNGSRRPASTLSLRRIAAALSARCGMSVNPVSLLHSDRIRARDLGGESAVTFVPFMTERIQQGSRDFIVLPLFFGPSRALTAYIPEQVDALNHRFSYLEAVEQKLLVRVADVLWKQPEGESRLVTILTEHVTRVVEDGKLDAPLVVLVDHGSPLPGVTAVRNAIASEMRSRLRGTCQILEAAMERRPGPEYAFSGPLLEEVLLDLAQHESRSRDVVLAMLFLSPGRHAGVGGDISDICADVQQRAPGLRITQTPLVGEHPLLVDILYDRLNDVLST
jgi:sirohydrochlorin ferrochelatase